MESREADDQELEPADAISQSGALGGPESNSDKAGGHTPRAFFRSAVEFPAVLNIEGLKKPISVCIRNLSATGAALSTASPDPLPVTGLSLTADLPTRREPMEIEVVLVGTGPFMSPSGEPEQLLHVKFPTIRRIDQDAIVAFLNNQRAYERKMRTVSAPAEVEVITGRRAFAKFRGQTTRIRPDYAWLRMATFDNVVGAEVSLVVMSSERNAQIRIDGAKVESVDPIGSEFDVRLVLAGTGEKVLQFLRTHYPDASLEGDGNTTTTGSAAGPGTLDGALEKIGPITSVEHEDGLYKRTVTCPNCKTIFTGWDVKTKAIVAARRDSDFMIHYSEIDPTWYAVWVCPKCNLAAYADDFPKIESYQLPKTVTGLAQIKRASGRVFDFSGYRNADLALRSFQLAMAYYSGRSGVAKIPGLYHRMAWIERARGNEAREQEWLRKARDAYEVAFTTSRSAEHGVLWAYLVGELDLRLGDPRDAAKWFAAAVAQEDFGAQPVLERMVRDRWSDASAAIKAAARQA